MPERELRAEIVKSGTWMYDQQVPSEIWIVKQNFGQHYDEGFEDDPEELNAEGETFQVVVARNGRKIGLGPSRFSLEEAVQAAEQVTVAGITWTDHILQALYRGRQHSTAP